MAPDSTTPDSPEGLTVEELARLKALAEAAKVAREKLKPLNWRMAFRRSDAAEAMIVGLPPDKVLALITQVERLTAERDGLLASIREAVEMLGDDSPHWGKAIDQLCALAAGEPAR